MDNGGCSRPTIFRRCARLMDRTLGQEIPLHLELADLLVQTVDQRGIALGLLILTVAKDAGGAIGEGLLPGLNLARVDFVPAASWATVSSPFTASSATLALKAGLCFLRPWDISRSSLAATAALSLGAGLSLSYLSSFLGPSHPVRVSGYVSARYGGDWQQGLFFPHA